MNTTKVRLSESQIFKIRESIKSVLGEDIEIYIFGSRTDLRKKGGDIDILVVDKNLSQKGDRFKLKIKILSKLYKAIGERKIDLLLTDFPKSDIEKIAITKGVRI